MNRLAHETSPYLRQHAENPVDWYPWGPEAFERAATESKPILLSVGYASCHWCHVMAHESFEDEATAKLMNELFVNVKVDREERPDVDAIYMEATQAMTGRGGWPMTVFLTPDRKPFFAGTYFPKNPMGDQPSFTDLMVAIDQAWKFKLEDVHAQAQQLHDSISARTHVSRVTNYVSADVITHACSALMASYDKEWGGFGGAPKFPQTSGLELLLTQSDPDSVAVVTNSLDAMASGGIYDHLGGGFARYSVDSFWMVPHFEKMLYDQATLARVYLHAFQITGEPRYRQVLEETVEYVLRDLRSPVGGLYSSEDADSEGEEGVFYIWRPEQVAAVLDDEAATETFKSWYGMTPSGNFEGANILHRPVRGDLLRSDDLEDARSQLFEARKARVRPALDDKVLTEWNAMFIATLAEAGAALQRSDWVDSAVQSAQNLLDNHRTSTGRWLRSTSGVLAFANDYAWLIEAFTRLSEATGVARWRTEALSAADSMLEIFWDDVDGGLFTIGSDAEQLIVRNKDLFDGAFASANSTAAVALIRIGHMTDHHDLIERARSIISLAGEQMGNYPTAFCNMAIAAGLLTSTTTETVIAGDHPVLVTDTQSSYLPRNVLLWGERDSTLLWEGREDGAFVCTGNTCGPVARSVSELRSQLGLTSY